MSAATSIEVPSEETLQNAQQKMSEFLQELSDDERKALLLLLYRENVANQDDVQAYGLLAGIVGPRPISAVMYNCQWVLNFCYIRYGSSNLQALASCVQSYGCDFGDVYPI